MSEANKRQVAGAHYSGTLQHWDLVSTLNIPYFPAQITRYMARWRKKNGVEDLEKALHYMDKYIEEEIYKHAFSLSSVSLFMNAQNIPVKDRNIFINLVAYQLGNFTHLDTARAAIEELLQEAKRNA